MQYDDFSRDDSSDYSSGDESVLDCGVSSAHYQAGDMLQLCDIEDDILSDCGSSVTSMCSDNTTAGDYQDLLTGTEGAERRGLGFPRKLSRPRTTIGFSRPLSTNMNTVGSNKQSVSADPRTRLQSEGCYRKSYNKDSEYSTLNVPVDDRVSLTSRSYYGCRYRNKPKEDSSGERRHVMSMDKKQLTLDTVNSTGFKNFRIPHHTQRPIATVVRFPPLGGAKPKHNKALLQGITKSNMDCPYKSKPTDSLTETSAH